MNKNNLLLLVFFCQALVLSAQSGKQKKADRLYENFAYTKAVDIYSDLLERDYNTEYNQRKLADSYYQLRDPENAVVYYEKVVQQPNVSPEYYFKYAQALRGVREYDQSREWLRKYQEEGRNGGIAESILDDEDMNIYEGLETFRLEPADFNSRFSDFGAYERNGTIYFTSTRAEGARNPKIYDWNGEPFLDVYSLQTGTSAVIPVEGDLNTKRHEGPVTISADGETMYFTRNNYLNNKNGKKDEEGVNHLKIYKASLVNNTWINVEELPFNDNSYSMGHPSLSADEKILYFASEAPGGYGGSDLYKVSISNGTYGTPENLGSEINTPGNEVFPFSSEDGRLFFSSDGHKGLGLLDIFVVHLDDHSNVQNLGEPINSSRDDFSFSTTSGATRGYISSNRPGGQGSDDIYTMKILEPLSLRGTITDSINSKPIANATIRLLDENNSQIAFIETDEQGNYETEIQRDRTYPIEARHIKYDEKTGRISTTNMDDETELVYDIELSPINDVEYLAEIDEIYFNFDKHNIRPDAARELDKLVDLMKNEYPELVIEIGSHTDSRGPAEYNKRLAERRAQATYDYLISEGIPENRIVTYQGYGEEQPEVECSNCSEQEHQLNRRSIFKVVKME